MNDKKDILESENNPNPFKLITLSSNPSCGCTPTSDGNDAIDLTKKNISVTIDGQVINVHPQDKNIVDVAKRNKIRIPVPCYLNERKFGCCNACIVEVDGMQKAACSTVPQHNMHIVVNRVDLKAIRKQYLLEYQVSMKEKKNILSFNG